MCGGGGRGASENFRGRVSGPLKNSVESENERMPQMPCIQHVHGAVLTDRVVVPMLSIGDRNALSRSVATYRPLQARGRGSTIALTFVEYR